MGKRRNKVCAPQGRCIFCNGVGLSKEHIWSDWLKDIIPLNDEHGEYWAALHRDRESSEIEWTVPPASRARQGCVLRRKVRIVCERNCNNGWMSRVVERAKPHAEQMIRGQSCQLDRQEQIDLAAWIGITTVVQEFANRRGARRIPPEDRHELMTSEAPPLSWSIWLAQYDGDAWAPMHHYHIPIAYSMGSLRGEQKPEDPPRHGLQLTTFTLSALLVHVFTSTDKEMTKKYRSYIGQSAKLPQLWPITATPLTWPPPSPFRDEEVDRLAFDWVQKNWNVRGMPGRPQEIELLKFVRQLAKFDPGAKE
jgi:hypothetical protein